MTYCITNSGVKINYLRINQEDITLHDIAHGLTRICRYGGTLDLNFHYSVAQHSILLVKHGLSLKLDKQVLQALLFHDATEAYLGDIITGLKALLLDYKEIESNLLLLIAKKYKLNWGSFLLPIIKELDSRILLDEAKAFMPHFYCHFEQQLPGLQPLGVTPLNETNLNDIYTEFMGLCRYLDIRD